MRSALTRAANRLAGGVRWYVRELMDESAYDRYVTHVRRNHPEAEVPSRRDFERMRTARQEADPRQGFRCC
ncbi:YbdD/YjiX family protein [Streptomyces sp. NPDC013161]|uniref:YbdD/YjiX family protein n=1 Tax=Streptomyces sp. NPDC013161 TaxID=3364862 RepID=UPI003680EED6